MKILKELVTKEENKIKLLGFKMGELKYGIH